VTLKAWTVTHLSVLAVVVAVCTFLSKSAAADQVRPVENRVTRLETQREEDAKRLEKIDQKLDILLNRTR
jgi:hypothetical protein